MFGALAPSTLQLVLPGSEDLWRASAFVLLLLHAAVVLGFIPAAAPALYSYGLLFLLVASSFHFLILVRSAQPDAVR